MTDIDDFKVAYIRGAFRALVASAEDLLAKSKADTPVDEGTLRDSQVIAYVVNAARFEGAGAADAALAAALAAVRAGQPLRMDAEVSANTPYAAAQHEGIAFMVRDGEAVVWQAVNHPGGGGPKFLERNLLEQAPRYERVIGASAQRGLEQEAARRR